jgi:hypothetical protein
MYNIPIWIFDGGIVSNCVFCQYKYISPSFGEVLLFKKFEIGVSLYNEADE